MNKVGMNRFTVFVMGATFGVHPDRAAGTLLRYGVRLRGGVHRLGNPSGAAAGRL